MNRSYNHIKHFADRKDVVKSQRYYAGEIRNWMRDPKHHANQLDDKQRHTRFDYYEYDMP